jgi:hypothetical protein
MSDIETIIIALSMAFCWINFNRWLKVKPFNCMMCMTGWLSAYITGIIIQEQSVIGACFHVFAMFCVGCLAGALFEAIKYRYL